MRCLYQTPQRKEYKSQREHDTKKTRRYLHKLKETMKEYTRSIEVQTNKIQWCEVRGGRGINGHKVPPITKKLFSVDTCWKRKRISFC